ncbi:apolipoprotein L6-like isoform X1 [Microcebus murinus]|uniref:apolipoprotein L6-like isoform X1 n=1 Tax=Microcebus murinus TaxID=30608 RepID=UPI003F6C2E71
MDFQTRYTWDEEEDFPPSKGEKAEDHLSAEEKIFLREFPRWKQDLEVSIVGLRALAEDIDEKHKAFTKTSLAANSVAVVSGVASILGLALAPVTAGGSLLLFTAGQGLGIAAGVTSTVTSLLEHSHKKKAQAQAGNLVGIPDTEGGEDEAKKELYASATSKIICGLNNMKKSLRAIENAKAHPHLAKAAKRLMTTGSISARRSREVQKAFGGTTLAMTKSVRMLGGAVAALGLGLDLAAVSRDWKQLQEGATAELADELRAQARKLENQLAELTEQYELLQQWIRSAQERMSLEAGQPHSGGKERGGDPVHPNTCNLHELSM